MKLRLIREEFSNKTTIGSLYIAKENEDFKFFCFTLEDIDRGLTDQMSVETINKTKIYGQTAIPYGTYKVIVNKSPKFQRMLPRLQNVKGFDGVLMHRGNFEKDTLGCILVGKVKVKDAIQQSTGTEVELVSLLTNATTPITLEIIKAQSPKVV